ncbi:MAG: PAS domain S-box protein [Chthoniobacterales bacterium]
MKPSTSPENLLCCLANEDLLRLVEEKEFFQKIFDVFPLLVALKSAKPGEQGHILIWNKFAADLTGIPVAEALGKRVDDFFPSEQREFFEGRDLETIKGRKPVVIDEEPIQPRSGGLRWLRTIKTPIYNADKQPLAILIVSEDITEQRNTRLALQSERTTLKGILENAPIGILVKSLQPDSAGRYLMWNRAMETMFDLPASKVIGNKSIEIFDPLLASVFNEQDLQATQGGRIELAPLSIKLGSGNLVIRTSKARIDDAAGQPLALVGVIDDITDSEKTSADLRETESRWQLAIAASDAGVWDWSAETGKIFLSQRMRELIRVPDNAICDSLSELVKFLKPEDIGVIREAMEEHLSGKVEIFRAEVRLNTQDETWLVVNGKAQIGESGRPTRAIGTVADITPVKVAERQMALSKESAESANQAKGDFLAMMSHEIRTPLNGVLGFADLLAESKLNDQQREFLQTIRDSGGALLAILNDILDYSKIEAGKLDVDLKPTDVRQIGQSLVAFFHPQAEKKGDRTQAANPLLGALIGALRSHSRASDHLEPHGKCPEVHLAWVCRV